MSRLSYFVPLLLVGCATAARVPAEPLAPGRYERTLEFGGIKRNYIIRIPKQAASGKPLPVVVVLHGWTGSAKLAEIYTNMAEGAESRGYISVFPDGLGKSQGWNVGWIDLSSNKQDDAGFVNALLDESEFLAKVDKNREYVCGHSNGAFLSYLVAAQYGKRLAAIGVVAGTIGVPGRTIPETKDPVSVIMIHGKKDPVVSYDPSFKATLKGISAPESARWWAKVIGADPNDPKIETSADGNVVREIWRAGTNKSVELISIGDGTHDWPRGSKPGEFDAAKALFAFFDARRK